MNILRMISDSLEEAVRIGPLFPVVSRLSPRLGHRHFQTRVGGAGVVKWRAGNSDRHVLHQVFASREYDLSSLPQWRTIMSAYNALLTEGKSPLIIDAGANIGAGAIWFARQFPEARVVSIEPDHGNAMLCRENTERLSNVEVLEAAIGGSRGSGSIPNPTDEPFAFRVERTDNNGSVPIYTVPDLETRQDNWALFLVKVDIEGFDDDLFSAVDLSWIDRTVCLLVEPHDWLLPGSSQSLQRAMALRNFDLLISGENLVYVRRD
jgi:FkbM family methyltransferase